MAESRKRVTADVDDESMEEVNHSELDKSGKSDSRVINTISDRHGIKLVLARVLIRLKNHIATVPFLMIAASMVLYNFCIRVHAIALSSLTYSNVNSFLFFCDTLCSILATLFYMNSQSRKSSLKKKYVFLAMTFVALGLELFFEYRYFKDINVETSLLNSPITYSPEIASSFFYTNVHIYMIYASMALAAAEPLLQPYFSKIRITF